MTVLTAQRMRWGIGAVVAVGCVLVGAGLTAASAGRSPWLAPAFAVALCLVVLAARWPLAAAALTLVALPIGLVHVAGPVKVAQALAALTIAGLGARRLLQGRTPLTFPAALRWAAALFIVALASIGTALDASLAYRQVFDIAVGLLFAAAVVTTVTDRAGWWLLTRALLFGGVAITGPALLSAQHLQTHFGGSVVSGRPVGIFSQPNELGTFSMYVVLLAVGVLLAGPPRRADRWLAAAAVLTSVGTLLLSLSRGAWIGATVGIIVLLVLVPRARRVVGSAAAVAVIGAALLGAFAPDAPQVHVVTSRIASFHETQDNPYDDRPRIWREAIREITTNPLLGVGAGNFPVASTRSISAASTVEAEHAHDLVLTVAAETGLPGLAALLGLTVATGLTLLRGLAAARRRGDRQAEALLGGVAAALGGLLGEGTVDFTLRNIVVAVTTWSLVALAIAGARVVRESPLPEAPPSPSRPR